MTIAPARSTSPAAPALAVETLGEAADERREWNALVEASPEGTFFHLAEWAELIARSFGHRPYYLRARAREDGSLRAVLPLVHLRSRLFGSALISTPFCVYGGAVARDEPSRVALEDAAAALADELGVDYLEVRNRRPTRDDWPVKELYVTFRKEIAATDEENLRAIPRKQRAMVRKAIAAGLESTLDEGIDRFYPIYAESVRNLGTPVFSRRYFEILRETFGSRCEVLTVTGRGRPLASVLSFYFRDEVLPYYGGGVAAARAAKANDFLYWELLRRAAARGVRLFDYGRSKVGSGSFAFKKNWGFRPEPLAYQYRLVRARAIPNVSPANPRYRRLVALWKRLPLPVANAVGPLLSRSLG